VVFDFTRFEFDGKIEREDTSAPFTAVSIVPCLVMFRSFLVTVVSSTHTHHTRIRIHAFAYTLSFCIFGPQAGAADFTNYGKFTPIEAMGGHQIRVSTVLNNVELDVKTIKINVF
jgi:hypothetical protein